MPNVYDRFVASPIGAGLAVGDGGLTLTTTLSSLDIQRTARGAIAHNTGTHGVEFAFWGESALVAAIGLVQAGSALTMAVGQSSNSVGWRLDTGVVSLGGATQATGLQTVAKQEIVGVIFRAGVGSDTAEFYRGSTLVHTQTLSAGASWYFAVSLAAADAASLFVAVNAGQWPALSAAARAGWQPPAASPATLRIADAHYLTAHTDTLADTRYEGIITDDGIETLSELGFWPWATSISPRGGSAQFTAIDPTGMLDGVESDTKVMIRIVDAKAALSSSEMVGRFVIDELQREADDRTRVRLRDPHDDLDEPINPGVFLPVIATLAWKPQPFVVGAVASVPLLPANSDGTVGFLCDGPLAEVSVVLDRGDAMEAGTWSSYGGNQVLLESPPLGPTVCDVSSIGSGMTPATLQQALHQVFSRVDKWSWMSSDAAAIDSATGYAGIGYYAGAAVSARVAIDAMLASYLAAYYKAADGNLRFVRLVAPESATATTTLDGALLGDDLIRVPDLAPNLSRRMTYRPNAAPLAAGDFVTDLVDVSVQRRHELMGTARGTVYSAAPLHSRYLAADRRDPMPSLFWRQQDAQAEIDYVCGLYAVERYFYRWQLVGDLDLDIAVGDVVRAESSKFGMAAGRNLFVAAVQRNHTTGRITLRLWGA